MVYVSSWDKNARNITRTEGGRNSENPAFNVPVARRTHCLNMGKTFAHLGADKKSWRETFSRAQLTFYRDVAEKSQRQSAQKGVIASAKRLDGP